MTELLERAFAELAKLPGQEQDAFAQRILDELAAGQPPQDLLGTYADMFAELTAPFQGQLQAPDLPLVSWSQAELKELFKQALLEVLQENREALRDLLAEMLRDE